MKFQHISQAAILNRQLAELIVQRQDATGNSLGVTIRGQYQSEEFVSLIRPRVLDLLDDRIELVKRELRDMGVTDI